MTKKPTINPHKPHDTFFRSINDSLTLMVFKVLKYIVQIIAHHLDQHKTNKIPLILPVVVYHGRVRATFANNINGLVDTSCVLVDQYFLKPFQLIDLTQEDDKNLQQNQGEYNGFFKI